MSQAEIMKFLDDNTGKYFTARQVQKHFKGKLNISSVYKALKKIIRRAEYISYLKIKDGQLKSIYGKKTKEEYNG